jgi:hypothetical protein
VISARQQLELDWLGGPAEARFRKRRPGIDDLPWGTLDAGTLDEHALAEARLSWTDGAFSEYASAAAFATLTTALLEAGAPIDLVAMAGDFVVDEMVHVELNARICGELGGAAPYLVDLDKVAPYVDRALPAIERAAELALTTSCIGEALSVPSLAGSMRAASHPLVRAVLQRIIQDESPHARLGWLVLDWAGDRIDKPRLAQVARGRLARYAPIWRQRSCPELDPDRRDVAGLMTDRETRDTLTGAVQRDIVAPLAARGIHVDVMELLAG